MDKIKSIEDFKKVINNFDEAEFDFEIQDSENMENGRIYHLSYDAMSLLSIEICFDDNSFNADIYSHNPKWYLYLHNIVLEILTMNNINFN